MARQSISLAMEATLLISALLLATTPLTLACTLQTKAVVASASPKIGTTDFPMSVSSATEFVNAQPGPLKLLPHYTTTFECVDSRAPPDATSTADNSLSTPGGDAAELAGGITTYCRVTGVKCTPELVNAVFLRFMAEVATPTRKFYLHQSEEKINKILTHVAEDLKIERPAILPPVAPKDEKLREKYLEYLTEDGATQGCGHLRLMIQNYTDYGLESAEVPQSLLKAFYNYWWPTNRSSVERSKISFPIYPGKLEGDAVLIVGSANGAASRKRTPAAGADPTCAHASPAVSHDHDGGQAFIYHADAVEDFRNVRLSDFFKGFAKATNASAKWDSGKFSASLKQLQATQLNATLSLLDVAKDCPLMTVTF